MKPKPPPNDADPAAAQEGHDLEDRRAERQRALIRTFVGRKVSLSTIDFHHLVGQLVNFGTDDRLQLLVNDREIFVRRGGVARIHAADPALAEYLK